MLQQVILALDADYQAIVTVSDGVLKGLRIVSHDDIVVREEVNIGRAAIMNLAVLLGHCIANHDPDLVVKALRSYGPQDGNVLRMLIQHQPELPF